jgi:hypothetical protein
MAPSFVLVRATFETESPALFAGKCLQANFDHLGKDFLGFSEKRNQFLV